jgi:hypothetical protein
MINEFLQSQAGLFDDSFKCSGLEGFVLRHDDRPRSIAQNQMRAGLSKLDKSTTFLRPNRFYSADVARDFHGTARIGSCEKCNRTLLGR